MPEPIRLTPAQRAALRRFHEAYGTDYGYPLRATKLSTWQALVDAGHMKCTLDYPGGVEAASLIALTAAGAEGAEKEKLKK